MPVIMEGKALASEIKEAVRKDVKTLHDGGIDVGLAVMRVGDNAASRQYYSAILRTSKNVDIAPYEYAFSNEASINEILNAVHMINHDERMHGLLILFPLPRRINSRRVVNAILPSKDIDGLGAMSVGRLAADESLFQLFTDELKDSTCSMLARTSFLPCTPFGVIRLLDHYNIAVKGKDVVVIGKSLAVGKPLSMMFLAKEATVTVCHKSTRDLASHTRRADILCTATGVSGLIKGDMVKEGAIVVDIGINVTEDGKITGDVDFDSVAKRAGYITPVPGGVGPVTISMLLENTVKSAQSQTFLGSPFQLE